MNKAENLFLKLKDIYLLILIIGAGIFLRFYKIDFQSPWLDEMFTLNTLNPGYTWSEIMEILKQDGVHPPLYYLWVYLSFEVFGNSVIVMRIFSAFFGVAGLIGMYYLGKELYNKNTGLIAALITTFNFFHISYSQEGRMYSLLFFFLVVSFVFLIRFIKKQRNCDLALYVLFISMAINTHFFAGFIIVSQYLIFLYLFFNKYIPQKKQFIVKVVLAGVLVLILIIPSILMYLGRTQNDGLTWIPLPSWDFFTIMLRELFGYSDIILLMMAILIIKYFGKLFNEKTGSVYSIEINKDKQSFTFLLLFMWILIGYGIPLVLSFHHLPILYNRYMIIILPAFILMGSIGFSTIKNIFFRISFVTVFVLISTIHIFFIRKYYSTITKSQFREVSEFIVQKNTSNDLIISAPSDLFKYFMKDANMESINLEQYIQEIRKDTTNLKSFWYANAHLQLYTPSLSESSEEFLNKNYLIEHKVEMYDAWAKHYVPIEVFKAKKIKVDPTALNKNSESIRFNIEKITVAPIIELSGWAFIDVEKPKNFPVRIVAIKDHFVHPLPVEAIYRPDIVDYFNNIHVHNSGFRVVFPKTLLKSGIYTIGIEIYDSENNLKSRIDTQKTFEINN